MVMLVTAGLPVPGVPAMIELGFSDVIVGAPTAVIVRATGTDVVAGESPFTT